MLINQNITKGEKIRIGVVGYGGRGEAIFRALGFASEKWATRLKKNGKPTSILRSFLDQDDLNIEIIGVCDIFRCWDKILLFYLVLTILGAYLFGLIMFLISKDRTQK